MSLLGEEKTPKQYWRSLDDLADNAAFRDWMEREFPAAASELPQGMTRRRWLQLMGASLALGGLAGCRWEAEEFAPFTVRPQNRVPGEKQSFATSWELAGVGRPLTVTSVDGRPIKIEGNRQHPFTKGGTDAFDQASILSLYDPDRSDGVMERVGQELVGRSWNEFDRALAGRLTDHQAQSGRGLAVLCGASSSLTRGRLRDLVRERFPESLWCACEPTWLPHEARGGRSALGTAVRTQFDMREARIIACFDADPLGMHPAAMRSTHDWADRRDPDGEWMNRVYAFESGLSLTGSNTDHRFAIKSGEIPEIIAKLERLIVSGVASRSEPEGGLSSDEVILSALADDLLRNRGQSVLLAGPHQPAEVHARIHRLNHMLDNVGTTISYTPDPVADGMDAGVDFENLVTAMHDGRVQTLLVLDVNAAYGLAGSERFRDALQRVPFSVHAGMYRDETAEFCRWHLPLAHPLEAWADARSWDGTITLAQPLIAPLFGGRTECEVLAMLTDERGDDAQQLLRHTLSDAEAASVASESDWRRAVHDGFVKDSAFAPLDLELSSNLDEQLPIGQLTDSELRDASGDIEIVLSPSSATFDGRFANNGWLQELPDAMTKLTWDNAAVMAPSTATSLGLTHGDVVSISANNARIELPAFVLPGMAKNSLHMALGYGRTRAGHVGGMESADVTAIGTDVSVLLADDERHVIEVTTIEPTGETRKLATTQDHFAIDTVGLEAIAGRIGELVRTGTLGEYEEHPDFAQHRGPHHPPLESLWEEGASDGHAWGMAIDLNRCIGCNACTIACQSENNVPVVGREQVLAGREMHWLRSDRYFAGDPQDPQFAHQPVACHHCENAPCEQVCPVAATVHSDEGLNDMVYNRCIGTRYCANNCPYKVRRFNFFDYNAPLSEPGNELTQMIMNPDVTIRSRGVMEKCTYCVHRIHETKIDAKNERRSISDGEIQTACQQACPAQAIVFGDLNDPNSAVAKLHADDRAYGMLAELNVKPRTKYLARIRNPHPWLADAPVESAHGTNTEHHS